MRKRYDAKFKTRVVLEALREQDTAAEIAAKYKINPNQITQWKKDNETEALKKRESELYQQIGQLKYEVDWLKKNLRSLPKSPSNRSRALDPKNRKLSLRRQCELLGLNRIPAGASGG